MDAAGAHLTKAPTRSTIRGYPSPIVRSPLQALTSSMSAAGKPSADTNHWGSFEPYAQLAISQLPRAASVTLFDSKGELRWSTDPTTGPDLVTLIEETLGGADTGSDRGELKML